MGRICNLLGVGLMVLICSKSFGQTTTLDAEFRPRVEFRQGFRKPLADSLVAGLVTLQRTRLNADYKSKVLNARLSLQDSRIWGNTDNKTNTSKIELFEAWFEYLIAQGISMQMGRQPLKYDDQRLFGISNWSNTGTAHDALVFKYSSPAFQIHAGAAYNNTKDTLLNFTYGYTPKQNYKTMGYLWLSKQLFTGATLSLIGVSEGFEQKTDANTVYARATYGLNLVYSNDSSAWGGSITAYQQKGKDPNKAYKTAYSDLSAYFLAAKLTYKTCEKLTANLGLDYYSGSEASIAADQSHSFNRLYGTTHSFNGNMEYFSTLPTQGLVDYYGGISTKLSPKFSFDLTGHLFCFDKGFVYNKVETEKNLGTEADVVLNYTVSKEIAIQGGYSRYFNSSSTAKYYKMQGIATHPQQWAYLMFTVKPQFYKTPAPVVSK